MQQHQVVRCSARGVAPRRSQRAAGVERGPLSIFRLRLSQTAGVFRFRTQQNTTDDGHGNASCAGDSSKVPWARDRAARAGLSDHLSVAPARRQRDPAQAPEPHLLPDQRRRPRSHQRGGRTGDAGRLRLVLHVLPRPGSLPAAGRHPLRDAFAGCGRGGRPRLGGSADAEPLGQERSEHRDVFQPHGHPVPERRRVRGGGLSIRPNRGAARAHRAVQGGRSRARDRG